MFHQLQCKSLSEAHLVRSRLLEREIESWVVNENTSVLFFERLMPPHLLIRDEDWEHTQEVMHEAIEPLDDEFLLPDDGGTTPERATSPQMSPPFPAAVFCLAVLYAAIGMMMVLIATISGILDGGLKLNSAPFPKWYRELLSLPLWFGLGGGVAGMLLYYPLRRLRRFRGADGVEHDLVTLWMRFAVLLYYVLHEFYVI